MKNNESSESVAAGCLLLIVSALVSAPLRAWCLIRIWDWHGRPLFGGPHVSVWQAWGLMVFLGLLFSHSGTEADTKAREGKTVSESVAGVVGIAILWPLLSLGVAWCLR